MLRQARRFASTGAIFKDSKANKTGLSHALDGTMRSGAHDLRTFGTGTLRALATRRALLEFLEGHRVFYSEMEQCLDSANGPTSMVWKKFQMLLRRTEALDHDVNVLKNLVGESGNNKAPSPAAAAYAARLREASQLEATGGTPLLIGHFYTRYMADLFGGSMLGWPTRLALQLPETPRFYVHPQEVANGRRETVEGIYEALNEAGAQLTPAQTKAVVDEAALAFGLNAALYKEGVGGAGVGMLAGAAVGGVRVAVGHLKDRLSGGRRGVFG